MNSQQAAEELARRRAAMPRTNRITVKVNVGYMDVDVDLAKIDIDDLREELRQRGNGESDCSDVEPLADEARASMERIYHLYRTGREAEANAACRVLIADTLGVIL